MLGSWLGLESATANTTTNTTTTSNTGGDDSQASTPSSSGAIRISPKRARTAPSPTNSNTSTKSEELLADADLIGFLCSVDERIKIYEEPVVDKDTLERLDALQTQASLDDCDVLGDIIECLQDENEKLKRVLAERRFGGPAENPIFGTSAATAGASLIYT